MQKRTLVDGRVVEVYCGCDEEWDNKFFCLGKKEKNDKCPECGYFVWTHFNTVEK